MRSALHYSHFIGWKKIEEKNLAEFLKTKTKEQKEGGRRRRKEYNPRLLGAITPLENNTHPPEFFIFSLTLFVRVGFYLPPGGFPSHHTSTGS
jgi:hypothetical protein